MIFKKQPINYFVMNKSFYILIILFLVACTNRHQTKYEKIESFFKEYYGNKITLSKYKAIVIVNDKGNCMNCTNAFSKYIAQKISNPKILFIISQNGVKVDISKYLNNERPNLILDRNEDFSKLNIITGSGILYLKGQRITDSLVIDYMNIESILQAQQIFDYPRDYLKKRD